MCCGGGKGCDGVLMAHFTSLSAKVHIMPLAESASHDDSSYATPCPQLRLHYLCGSIIIPISQRKKLRLSEIE